MRALGIFLIVVGLALVCGALILWAQASRTYEEEEAETQKREERTDSQEPTVEQYTARKLEDSKACQTG